MNGIALAWVLLLSTSSNSPLLKFDSYETKQECENMSKYITQVAKDKPAFPYVHGICIPRKL